MLGPVMMTARGPSWDISTSLGTTAPSIIASSTGWRPPVMCRQGADSSEMKRGLTYLQQRDHCANQMQRQQNKLCHAQLAHGEQQGMCGG